MEGLCDLLLVASEVGCSEIIERLRSHDVSLAKKGKRWVDMTYLALNGRQSLPLLGDGLQGLSNFHIGEAARSKSGAEVVDVGAPRILRLTLVSNLVRGISLGVTKLPSEEVARVLSIGNLLRGVALYPGLVVCSVLELVGVGGALQSLNRLGTLARA